MKKQIIVLIAAAFLIFTGIFLFQPTSYQITVYNSRYFGNCSSSKDAQNQCKPIEPPTVITKRESYIVARWNKAKIDRQFAVKDVSVQWSSNGDSIYQKTGLGTLSVLFALLPLLVLVGIIYLLISTLMKAMKLKGTEKIAWVCLILFTFPLGSIIFIFVKPKEK